MSVVRFRWATDAHNATKDIQALLKKYEITDTVSIEFAEMFLKRVDGS